MAKHSQVKTELKGVHLCCQGCVDAADDALMSVAGVTSHCDMEKGTVALTAGNDVAAQKALDALAAAGFYGRPGNQKLEMKPLSEIPTGKVNSLKVSGIHNCCEPCCEAIKEAIATVSGVTGDTAEPEATTFEVIGNFDAAVLVKALNAAGFSARVE
ncbi:MAG: hypothetical protein CV088_04390 [Nitrospira sp. LK70]|nr:hypothetical protein [Nitrospira sp. LK70]